MKRNVQIIHEDEISSLLKQFDFKITSFGHFDCSQASMPKPSFLLHFRLAIIKEGAFNLVINNIDYNLNPGDCLILSPHQLFTATSYTDKGVFYYFDFNLENPVNYRKFQDLIHLQHKNVYPGLILKRQIDNLYYLEKNVEVDFPGTYLLVEGTLLRVFIVMIKYLTEHDVPLVPKLDTNPKNALLHQCIDYINEHINEQILIKDMANKLNYSENYIYKAFKEILDISCSDFILNVRLNNAMQELFTTKHTISEIAENNGFNTVYHFSSAFKKKYGYAPSNIRKENIF